MPVPDPIPAVIGDSVGSSEPRLSDGSALSRHQQGPTPATALGPPQEADPASHHSSAARWGHGEDLRAGFCPTSHTRLPALLLLLLGQQRNEAVSSWHSAAVPCGWWGLRVTRHEASTGRTGLSHPWCLQIVAGCKFLWASGPEKRREKKERKSQWR